MRLDRGELRPLLSRVQLRKDIPLAHRPPGLERHTRDGARQIGAHGHPLHRRNRPDCAQRRRPVFGLGDDGGDRLRGRLKGGALRHRGLNLPELHEPEQRDDSERHREHHNHSLRHELPLTPCATGPSITCQVAAGSEPAPVLLVCRSIASGIDKTMDVRAPRMGPGWPHQHGMNWLASPGMKRNFTAFTNASATGSTGSTCRATGVADQEVRRRSPHGC